MKKLLFIIALAFVGCTAEEQDQCDCISEVTRQTSYNDGKTWEVEQDERSGMQMPCKDDGKETEITTGDFLGKTVWNCKD